MCSFFIFMPVLSLELSVFPPFFSILGFKRPSTGTVWSDVGGMTWEIPSLASQKKGLLCGLLDELLLLQRCYRKSYTSLQNWQHKQEPGNCCYACSSDYLTPSILNFFFNFLLSLCLVGVRGNMSDQVEYFQGIFFCIPWVHILFRIFLRIRPMHSSL